MNEPSRFSFLTREIVAESQGMGLVDIEEIAAFAAARAIEPWPSSTPGQQVHILAAWNEENRKACSEAFAAEVGLRCDINGMPELVALNGVRRGVKRAIKLQQKAATSFNREKLSAIKTTSE